MSLEIIGMRNAVFTLIVFLFAAIGGIPFFYDKEGQLPEKPFLNAQRIAHAGGGFRGDTYTNSLEALNFNYEKGFRFFELDFSWTSDASLVCIHDWQNSFEKYFGFSLQETPSKEVFELLVKDVAKYRMLTLQDLVEWLIQHPDAKIITDVKNKNLKGLAMISEEMGPHLSRVIPQIYHPDEYQPAKMLGFENIIWTLYRDKRFDEDIIKNAKEMDLFAVTMPTERANRGLGKKLHALGLATYVHTINKSKDADRYFQDYGISEVYTDFLPVN